MNIETIKTIILSLLVGFSLLLTFSLWNSQPNLDYISNHPEYVSEVDIGGKKESNQTIIQPDLLVFHQNDKYYGLMDPIHEINIYEKMQIWELDNYQISNASGLPNNPDQIEVIFPTSLPVELIKSLFNIEGTEDFPSWTFKRIFITFSHARSQLKMVFLSTDRTQKVEYVIKDPNAYNYLRPYTRFNEKLSEYVLFDGSIEPIYLPAEPRKMRTRSLTIQTIDPYLLVNALFSNPSNVSPNIGEAFFTDGQRGMHILDEGRSMEYINPIHSNGEFMNSVLLLERSLEKVNEHKGWTNEFVLDTINFLNNSISYRMQYDGYPIFSHSRDHDMAMIEQRLLNQELHLYRRPLFKLDNLLGGEEVELAPSKDIIEFLKRNEYYDHTRVNDIKIGYKLAYAERTSYSLTLEPAWYMNYGGNWMEIRIEGYDYF